jgi:hypothetical protein
MATGSFGQHGTITIGLEGILSFIRPYQTGTASFDQSRTITIGPSSVTSAVRPHQNPADALAQSGEINVADSLSSEKASIQPPGEFDLDTTTEHKRKKNGAIVLSRSMVRNSFVWMIVVLVAVV